jgi:ABC-type multidrug transport system fused ATPase/permease subunit
MSANARQLLLLNAIKMAANIYRLTMAYCTSLHKFSLTCVAEAIRYRVQNKAWHRLNLMKGFSLNEKLRRDISVTGIESWLTEEMDAANEQLGDIPTRPPWHGRASSSISFARHLIGNCIESAEYLWLVYHGLKKGITLGTLQLIRSSATEVMDHLWGLSYTADNATEEWKNLVAFYKILEVKSEIKLPENPVEYVSSPNGMKIEAKEIRYKYDMKSEEEVLKGTSFVINPGEMIAVVGYIRLKRSL